MIYNLLKYILLLFVLIFYSCNRKPLSTGPNNQITIIVSDDDSEFVKLYLEPLFKREVYTPIKENMYDLNFVNTDNININKYKKNIIIVSLENPVDKTVDLLNSKIRSQYNDNHLLSFNNLYSENQVLINIFSYDATKFGFDLEDNKNWILNEINSNVEKNILNDINSLDKNNDLINTIQDKFGYTILIDENYKLIRESDDYIWIGRGYPYRWIIINEIHDTNPDESVIKNNIIDFFNSRIEGLEVSDYMLKYSDDTLRGLYEHEESQTGGPFFTYKYRNSHTNKLIFISGFVNNPGKEKAYLLFQLETIIKNIREVYE